MPINNNKYSFKEINLVYAPDHSGVYALWDGSELIYYGKSEDSVRDRLSQHLNGHDGYCTKNASHFQTETSYNPSSRERELLNEYRYQYGRLPRCNDVMP